MPIWAACVEKKKRKFINGFPIIEGKTVPRLFSVKQSHQCFLEWKPKVQQKFKRTGKDFIEYMSSQPHQRFSGHTFWNKFRRFAAYFIMDILWRSPCDVFSLICYVTFLNALTFMENINNKMFIWNVLL